MTHNRRIRAAAYGMAMLIAASGMGIQADAAKLSEVLPSAGIGLSLSGGVSLAAIREKVLAEAEEDPNLKLSVSELKAFLEENQTVSRETVLAASVVKEAEVHQVLAEAEKEAMQQEVIQVESDAVLAEAASGKTEEVLSLTAANTKSAGSTQISPVAGLAAQTASVSTGEAGARSAENTAQSGATAASDTAEKTGNSVFASELPKEDSLSQENESGSGTKENTTSDSSQEDTSGKEETGNIAEKAIEETQSTAQVVAEKMASLTEEERGFTNLVIAQVDNYVNVRSDASENSEILGKLYDKSVGEFISEKDGWYKITSGNVTGYVKAEYCVTGRDAIDLAKEIGTRVATVTTTTLRVREEASTESATLGMVPIGEELIVVEEMDGWVKVDIEEGYGWVSTDYVTLRTDFVKAESKEEENERLTKEEAARNQARAQANANSQKVESSGSKKSYNSASSYIPAGGGSASGNAVSEFALQFVGNPYVYGGSSLTNGTDCSGFVMSVYKNFGVSLPHSSTADRSVGSGVSSLAEAQPGDLICYSGHVGLYIGDGKIVHASNAKTGIIVSNAAYRNILAIRRIF